MARVLLSLIAVFTASLWCGGLQERAPGVQRLRFEIEVDPERARTVGWIAPDDEGVVALAARIVQDRLTAMGRAALVEVVPGAKRFRLALPSIDAGDAARVEGLVRSLGVCEFLFATEDRGDRERPRLKSWTAAHPTAPLEEFNVLEPAAGGPSEGCAWFPTEFRTQEGQPVIGEPMLVRLPGTLADHFGAADFARTYATHDSYGYPGIGFELVPTRADDFARVTGEHLQQNMAVVLGSKIRSAPVLNSKLAGKGLIEGRFGADEVTRITAAITGVAGPLRLVEAR